MEKNRNEKNKFDYKKPNPYTIINIEKDTYMSAPESVISIGGYHIYFRKRFNWIQRKLMKICFGLKVENFETKKGE